MSVYCCGMPMNYSSGENIFSSGENTLRASSEPCPICGHATSNCFASNQEAPRIIGADIFPSLGYEDVFVIKEDVYRDRMISQFASVPTLILKAGSKISITKARELGLS